MSGRRVRSPLTTTARRQLEQELTVLRDQRREFVEGLGEEPVGDSGDRANALVRADDLARVDERITEIADLLAHGRVTEETADTSECLQAGTEVTLRFPDGTIDTLRVAAIVEEITAGEEATTLTSDSPLGRALAGRQAGDRITYSTPSGQARAQVVAVRPPRDQLGEA